MTTEQDFIDQIIADPDDDNSRLVYADWLEEHGDSRSEFIRLQCRLGRADEADEDVELRRRVNQLQAFNFVKLTEDLEGLPVTGHVFRRGFIEEVTMTSKKFVKSVAQVLDRLPLLNCVSIKRAFAPSILLEVDDLLPRLPGIALRDGLANAGYEPWQSFFHRNHWQSLRYLEISRPSQMSCFDQFDLQMPKLRSLKFTRANMQFALVNLVMSRIATQLTSLSLVNSQISNEMVPAIARHQNLAGLEELNLNKNSLSGPGIEAITNSKVFRSLKVLRITKTKLTKRVVKALLDSELPSLVRIQVSIDKLNQKAVEELRTRFVVSDW